LLRERLIVLAGIAAGARGDFRRQQCRYDAVLVGGPRLPVDAAEGRARAFLAAESQRTVDQAGDEPFESDRNLIDAALQARSDLVDHRAAHDRLAYGRIRPPA